MEYNTRTIIAVVCVVVYLFQDQYLQSHGTIKKKNGGGGGGGGDDDIMNFDLICLYWIVHQYCRLDRQDYL